MEEYRTSGQIIKSLCEERNISKSELARRLGVTPSQITRIINEDTKTISSDILIKIVMEFGVSADYILGITHEKNLSLESRNTAAENKTAKLDNTAAESKESEPDNIAAESKESEPDNTAAESKESEPDNTAAESKESEPDNITIKSKFFRENNVSTEVNNNSFKKTRTPMILMSSAFECGKCIEFIESIKDEDEKKLAYAEYYYFCGKHENAVEYTELYLQHDDPILKLSASFIYTFANLSLNRINSARFGLEKLQISLKKAMSMDIDKKTKAFCIFVASAAHTLLHLQVGDIPPLSEYLHEFTKGMQLWGAYVLAHEAYLKKEYERSLGIVQASLMTCDKTYPIAMIYLNLVAAMDAMNMMQKEVARKHFMEAYTIAKPDDLIEAIGEHHGLLQGLIETCMKKDYPEDYARIIEITYKFSAGWRRIHNPDTKEDVADNLTTTEFTIAMLANKGWTNNEIADYMDISARTVKQHMTCIFNKLNITNRKQLSSFMLR